MCEDYRAAVGIDLEHDREDRATGRRIQCPVHAIWGEHGVVNRCFRPLDEWRKVTDARFPVTGHPVPSGHYIAEQIPERAREEILAFLEDAT
jgi:haloacetate dehalogenase